MSQRSLAVTVGAEFNVEFLAPTGAGYEWQLESTPAGIELSQCEVRVEPGAAIGSGATFVFHLRATRTGRVTLAFLLKRRWEPTAAERELVDIDAR